MSVGENVTKPVCAIDHFIGKYSFLLINQFGDGAGVLTECFGDGQEAIIVQIDYSAAFDRVNHQWILFKLCSVGVGGSVLSVLSQFLSSRSQYVVANWLTWCQGYLREGFWAFCTLQSFSL